MISELEDALSYAFATAYSNRPLYISSYSESYASVIGALGLVCYYLVGFNSVLRAILWEMSDSFVLPRVFGLGVIMTRSLTVSD